MIRVRRRASAEESFDITFILGHAHVEQDKPDLSVKSAIGVYWKTVCNKILFLPRRTVVILSIDANGHVGYTGSAGEQKLGTHSQAEPLQ